VFSARVILFHSVVVFVMFIEFAKMIPTKRYFTAIYDFQRKE
jgi:hypothetical protein